ncbi:MAG TPA: VIT domain-containing protein [Polyangia bacterium]
MARCSHRHLVAFLTLVPVITAARAGVAAQDLRAGAGPSATLAEISRRPAQAAPYGMRRWAHQDGIPQPDGEDRTLAPYFTVAGDDKSTEQIPLKSTSGEVAIAGAIARVKVKQVFENTGQKPIEAVYVFPASTRASVHGMRMTIGSRTIEARIDRRAAARAAYQEARDQGKRASLLEQERPNVFTMNVANVMPGDRIAVELEYSELVIPEDAVYEFVYPTVVGPRYGGGTDPQRDTWIANPTLRRNAPDPYAFDVRVHLETGIALKEMSSPSHEIDVAYGGSHRADVRLKKPGGGNRDFVLRYRLAGDRIETGVLLWEDPTRASSGDRETFFALMMEPPRRPDPAQIPPREYIFLLDVSGSMQGFPLDTTKALMRKLFANLRSTDQFNVALFSGASAVLAPEGSLSATPANLARALEIIDGQRGGGGTELMGGLEAAYAVPRRGSQVARTVVVVTDGYVGVEARAFRFIRERLDQANLFAFGIGSSVNRGLIEGMARAGVGAPFLVLSPTDAAAEADKLRALIETPVLTRIQVSYQGLTAVEMAPAKVPDLLARRPLIVFGKFRGNTTGRIDVSGSHGGGRFHQSIEVGPGAARAENAALRWLWARKWAEILEDEHHMGAGSLAENAITELGLAHNLLTSFTSFVAIDSAIVNREGRPTGVRQPLPLPQGVPESALGGLSSLHGPAIGRAAQAKGFPMAEMATKRSVNDSVDEMANEEEGTSAPEPERRKATRHFELTLAKSQGVGDTAPFLKALATALEGLANRCAPPPGRRPVVTLRFTVDAAGIVRAVTMVTGEGALARCLEKPLAAVTSATRAVGERPGSIEVTFTLR